MANPQKKCAPTQPMRDWYKPPHYCRTVKATLKEDEDDLVPIKQRLLVTNPAKLLTLISRLVDTSTQNLEILINKYLMRESESELTFHINLNCVNEEAMVQACGLHELKEPLRKHVPSEILKRLVQYKNKTLVGNENLDEHFLEIFNEMAITDKYLCAVPILSNKTETYPCDTQTLQPVYLICYLNSKKGEDYLIKLTNELFMHCLSLVLNARQAEEQSRQRLLTENLLAMVKTCLRDVMDLDALFKDIMYEVKKYSLSERCILYIVDNDEYLIVKHHDRSNRMDRKVSRDKGIVGHVSRSGQVMNVRDVHSHSLFCKRTDELGDVKIHDLLCFPIWADEKIIAVMQICNKRGGNFHYGDEQMVNLFSIFAGLAIQGGLLYKKTQQDLTRNRLVIDLLLYHKKVQDEDVVKRLHCPRIHFRMRFSEFSFSPQTIPQCEATCFVRHMLNDLEFDRIFKIQESAFTRFLLLIEMEYRDLPYHNYHHAFSVCHFVYLCLKNLKLIDRNFLTKLEALALFISSLCHDVDYRGIMNPFGQRSGGLLLNLYSSQGSVMEHHHLSQTLLALSSEGCNFLDSLTCEEYTLCINLIKDMILATDLASHFDIYNRQAIMVQGGYHRNNAEHRYLLACLLMTCADLSEQTKEWPIVKKVAEATFEEYFAQYDDGKNADNGENDVSIIDHQKIDLPGIQVTFLNKVCLPLYQLLDIMFDQAIVLTSAINRNILCWEASKCFFRHGYESGKSTIDMLKSEELEIEVTNILRILEHPEEAKAQESERESEGDLDIEAQEFDEDQRKSIASSAHRPAESLKSDFSKQSQDIKTNQPEQQDGHSNKEQTEHSELAEPSEKVYSESKLPSTQQSKHSQGTANQDNNTKDAEEKKRSSLE